MSYFYVREVVFQFGIKDVCHLPSGAISCQRIICGVGNKDDRR